MQNSATNSFRSVSTLSIESFEFRLKLKWYKVNIKDRYIPAPFLNNCWENRDRILSYLSWNITLLRKNDPSGSIYIWKNTIVSNRGADLHFKIDWNCISCRKLRSYEVLILLIAVTEREISRSINCSINSPCSIVF